MELLTIDKKLPHFLEYNIFEPLILINELKKIVKELKQKNPCLKNYKLMDVGFSSSKTRTQPRMRLYFIKKSL
ncbi:MAG: hypothetical protein ACOX15_05620 [Tepidanaerobacteraceae bacterium]|jgi:hypothetical protein